MYKRQLRMHILLLYNNLVLIVIIICYNYCCKKYVNNVNKLQQRVSEKTLFKLQKSVSVYDSFRVPKARKD